MSIKFDDLSVLLTFGKIRRRLNLMATQALKPFGIGPKQATLLRELSILKVASSCDLARETHTDPAAAGKALDLLIEKGWVRRVDDPEDRRRWLISLTSEGKKLASQIENIYQSLAQAFCTPLSQKKKETLHDLLSEISVYLKNQLEEKPYNLRKKAL